MYSSEKFYTEFADSYAQYAGTKKAYLSAVNNFIKDEAGSVKTMIDIGSGDGKRAKEISSLLGISNFTLVDNSKGMISLSKSISGANVIEGDISNIEFKSEQKYDAVLCLWNVLGHIPLNKRKVALINLASLINKNGIIFLDVNNRHNITHYGLWAVIKNICKDIFTPKKSNGDFDLHFNTNQGGIDTTVHIFNPFEIEKLIRAAGLSISKKEIIDYKTGEIRKHFWNGQLVYKLTKI